MRSLESSWTVSAHLDPPAPPRTLPACRPARLSLSPLPPNNPPAPQKNNNNSYNEIFDELEANGIEPSVTLHHFTHPAWLDEWCGGFEGDASVEEFARWASLCGRLFGTRVRYWATFNEPTCSMFLGWITGMHTPGKIVHCGLAGKVLRNMLRAHRAAYDALKAVDPTLQVGLVHHHIRFEAQGPKWLLWPAEYCCKWMNFWWGYDLMHRWMLTGEVEWSAPLGCGEGYSWRDPQGKPPMDWFGVNYYSRAVSFCCFRGGRGGSGGGNGGRRRPSAPSLTTPPTTTTTPLNKKKQVVSWYLKPTAKPGEIMTDMYYPVYAQGLYEALVQAKELNVPVYITETGCADKGDSIRPLMIDEYVRATLRAMRDGVDVRGFYYWVSFLVFFGGGWGWGGRGSFVYFAGLEGAARPPFLSRAFSLSRHLFSRLDLPPTTNNQHQNQNRRSWTTSSGTPATSWSLVSSSGARAARPAAAARAPWSPSWTACSSRAPRCCRSTTRSFRTRWRACWPSPSRWCLARRARRRPRPRPSPTGGAAAPQRPAAARPRRCGTAARARRRPRRSRQREVCHQVLDSAPLLLSLLDPLACVLVCAL